LLGSYSKPHVHQTPHRHDVSLTLDTLLLEFRTRGAICSYDPILQSL
jgi:hypothetical protein